MKPYKSVENLKSYIDLVNDLFEYNGTNLIWRNPTNCRIKKGDVVGCKMPTGYIVTSIVGVQNYVHRIIFLMCNGFVPKEIDHINGDNSDNRIENLRECTKSQNQHNKKLYSNNRSGIKGVSWCKVTRSWVVQVKCGTEVFRKCGFFDVDTAEQVAKIERLRMHKEFANNGEK